jgi:hypothetical protein
LVYSAKLIERGGTYVVVFDWLVVVVAVVPDRIFPVAAGLRLGLSRLGTMVSTSHAHIDRPGRGRDSASGHRRLGLGSVLPMDHTAHRDRLVNLSVRLATRNVIAIFAGGI